MTVLFYLNNVTGGGETVFPVADNRTYDEMVSASWVGVVGWQVLGQTYTPLHTWDEDPGGPLAHLAACLHAGSCGEAGLKAVSPWLSTESNSG